MHGPGGERIPMRNVIRKSLAILIIVIAASPAGFLSAQDSTTSGLIEVRNVGSFSAELCQSGVFGEVGITSSRGGIATAVISICYYDNAAKRPGQEIKLAAGDFESKTHGVDAFIPASNLRITTLYSPQRTLSDGCAATELDPELGAIHASDGISSIPMTDTNQTREVITWTQGNSLDTARVVGLVDEGKGTSVCENEIEDVRADIELELTVPAGQSPANYESILELQVVPDTP